MKYFILIPITLILLASSCQQEHSENPQLTLPEITSAAIPNKTTDKSMLHFDMKTSIWTIDDQRYSGYAVSYHNNGTLKEKTGILNGKTENQENVWYADGHLKQISNYHNGILHGEKKFWLSDTTHVLASHLNYQSGKPHGAQKTWYPTGELHKKLNLNMGREEGLQQAYRKNGVLYANYEAKNGRIFGLKKAQLCYGLEDEKMSYEK